METSISQEWIRMLLIARKISPHKTLLMSYRQQKIQRRIQSYQITALASTSNTRNPQKRYMQLSNHLKIP